MEAYLLDTHQLAYLVGGSLHNILLGEPCTPGEFRGRISAVNTMLMIGSPILGQLESRAEPLSHRWQPRIVTRVL